MTDIGPELRALIVRARKNPVRWGKPRGLSQQELATLAGTSAVWLRQIETGYTQTATASTLGSICYTLGIKPYLIKKLGYKDIAQVVEDCTNQAKLYTPQTLDDPEQHLRDTPGLTSDEKEQLIDALQEIRRQEPLGRDMWQRRKKA
jgi:transcriptional regulator with XRE-family HTH domain